MTSIAYFGAFLAIVSAVFFGCGDFAGGLASRKATSFQVLAVSSLAAMILMGVLAFIWHDPLPQPMAILWSGLAGTCGAAGLAALYHGLAAGKAAIVSPVSGVIAAILPVGVAALKNGLPGVLPLVGFAVALPGIWMVSTTVSGEQKGSTAVALATGGLAGICFGLFFVFLSLVPAGSVFWPMATAKTTAFVGALLLLAVTRQPFPRVKGNPAALLAGVLDPTANTLYFLATTYTRLDIAAVLSSLYPAVTVLLSRVILKERIRLVQWIGLGLCIGSIALITA